MTVKLACGYARCSTDDQAGSLPAQWKHIEDYAKQNGYEVVERFQDDGVSGTSLDRPGLQMLIAAGNGAKWEHVLVWDRSRLGRPEDPREAIVVTYNIERAGKIIVPLHGTKHTDNPIINTILEALEFGQAGEESIRKSRDVLRGQMESAKKGSLPNGKIPYGYDAIYSLNGKPMRRVRWLADRSKLILSVDGKDVTTTMSRKQKLRKADEETLLLIPGAPDKVAVVQRIYSELIAGLSTRSIAHKFNREGIPAPRGKTWGRTMILRVITNPAYKGTFAWNRQTWAKFHAVQEDGKIARVTNPKKRWKAKPESEWVVKEGLWEGLVSVDDWNRANTILHRTKPHAMQGKGAKSKFLASGLLKCVCGSHFSGCSSADKHNPNRRDEHYRCIASIERGPTVCAAKRIRRSVVDAYLERRLHELYFQSATMDAVWLEIEKQLDSALAVVERNAGEPKEKQRLSEVEQEIGRLVKALTKGRLTEEEADMELPKLRKEREALFASQTQSQTFPNLKETRKKVLAECRHKLQTETHLWPTATHEQRKAIVRAHVASMTADYANKTIRTEFYPLVGQALAAVGIAPTLGAECDPSSSSSSPGLQDTACSRCVTNTGPQRETGIHDTTS